MSTLILLESSLTGTGINLIDRAAQLGHKVKLLTSRSEIFKQKFNNPLISIIEKNIYDSDLQDFLSIQLLGESKFAITTTHDRCITLCAQMAKAFNVPGLDPEGAQRCESKISQDEFLGRGELARSKPLPVALNDNLDLDFPLVLKPEFGVASAGVWLCHNFQDLLENKSKILGILGSSFETRKLGTLITERYLDGPEFCVELFNGQCVGIVEKKNYMGSNDFLELGYIARSDLQGSSVQYLSVAAEQAVRKLNVGWGASHVDVKMTSDGAVVVEVNPRLAGSVIPALVEEVYGIDLVGLTLDLIFGNEQKTPIRSKAAHVQSAAFFILDLETDLELPSKPQQDEFESVNIEYYPQVIPSRKRSAMVRAKTNEQVDLWNLLVNYKESRLRC